MGLNSYLTHGLCQGVNFPLLCVINYMGFRLLASSELPISMETLVYGCSNAGTPDSKVFFLFCFLFFFCFFFNFFFLFFFLSCFKLTIRRIFFVLIYFCF